MVSENRVAIFFKTSAASFGYRRQHKIIGTISAGCFEQLNLAGYPYVFLSAIFIEPDGSIKKSFFTDKLNKSTLAKVTIQENLFKKGSEWEMKVMYGEAAVVSDVSFFINSSYAQFSSINSLIFLPIQHLRKLSGILILASSKEADQVNAEEIEFGEMITRLINLSFRLEDTEGTLTQITQTVYEMNAKLHQLDKLKDDFVSIASHELRTPMTAVRSYAWMALNRSDSPLSPKLEKYIVRILISTERLINLVNDMLNISRIESGRIEIIPERVNVIELTRDIVDEAYYSKAMEKNIHISIMEEKLPPVFADPEKLRQVMLNIIGNAVKFVPSGGRINISFFTDGKSIEVSISDSGPGISKEDLGKLFKKFSRLENTYSGLSMSGGTGLGLYISKSIIELMHGRIWARSEGSGKGATFTFSLPVATPEVVSHAEQFKVKATGGEAKGLEPAAI